MDKYICCGSILSLVQIFFSFVFLGMVTYDNNMIMSLKQKERKFEPRIKLNHNISTMQKEAILRKCVNTFVPH